MPKGTVEIAFSEFETPPEVSGGKVFGMFVVLIGLFSTFAYAGFLITSYIWEKVFS